MNNKDVRIVKLEPMHTACFHAYSAGPELEAAKKLEDWAKPLGLLDAGAGHRIYGFNNPDPMPGSPNYGYSFHITLAPDFETGKDVTTKDFPGGLYGVARVEGVQNITTTWQKLMAWRAQSQYKSANHQWLEEPVSPRPFTAKEENMVLDLYIPIKE